MGVLKNEVPQWIALAVWISVQIGLFGYYFWFYSTSPKFAYVRMILRVALSFARSAASCINFNCMLILLPVCRNLISFIRRILRKCCIRSIVRLLDKNITFHKLVSYAICFWTAVHAIAHFYNLELFVAARSAASASEYVDVYRLSALGSVPCPVSPADTRWVNPVCDTEAVSILEAFKIFPALSGVIISLCLIVIIASATEFIRRSYFEIFWFTHHLFIVFFIFLVVHGFRGVVRSQQPEHQTENCTKIPFDEWTRNPQCPMPVFNSNTPSTWKWVITPMILYFIERLIRVYRSFQKVAITKVVKHPSKVIELQMRKKGFSMEAGQYIFLKCPSISRLEWHPFTLTSSPEEEHFSIHVRIAGDWTEALAKAIKADGEDFQESWSLPSVAVDGPFGTASEDWDQYEVDVLIGAGIGVTPFASIMKHMWYTYIHSKENNVEGCKLKKVYFYWICPDTNAFEWFADLLHHLEQQMEEKNCPDFLSYYIFLTRGWDVNFARNIALHETEQVDAVTGLQQKTHYGRPNWDQIFKELSDTHRGTSVGVFFCGPSALSKTLHKMSNKHSTADGAKFVYNKENF